jgi:NAD+ synthase (glutamine-hydrolysing)
MTHTYETIIKVLKHTYRDIAPFNKFIIGLSGGLDSAVVAVLAVLAVGKENVICINLPSEFNSNATQKLAFKIANNLDIEFRIHSIQNMVGKFKELLGKNIDIENLQPRIRGLILQTVASAEKGVVLSCSNKSELMTGYFTYCSADDIGAIAPIGGLFKTEVYKLAEYINAEFGDPIPSELIPNVWGELPLIKPSAELKEGQFDPFDYYKDDEILKQFDLIDLGENEPKTNRYKELEKIWQKTEWKRKQCPPFINVNNYLG